MQRKTNSFSLLVFLIVLAIASRFLPHWHNFTAVGAVGLFGAAYFKNKLWAYAAPFVALFVSDLILNNVIYAHYFEGFTVLTWDVLWNYLSFGILVLLGLRMMRKLNAKSFVAASLAGTLGFYLISNFGVFVMTSLYPKSMAGLVAAYGAALPFALNSLLANLLYGAVLIGGFELVRNWASVSTRVSEDPA